MGFIVIVDMTILVECYLKPVSVFVDKGVERGWKQYNL